MVWSGEERGEPEEAGGGEGEEQRDVRGKEKPEIAFFFNFFLISALLFSFIRLYRHISIPLQKSRNLTSATCGND